MAKITGKEGLQFRGPARVFDSEEDMIDVVTDDPQKLKVTGLQEHSILVRITNFPYIWHCSNTDQQAGGSLAV